MNRLPFELRDLIISHLVDIPQNFREFSRLRLVSKQFEELLKPYFFRRFCCNEQRNSQINILVHRPDVRPLVRSAFLDLRRSDESNEDKLQWVMNLVQEIPQECNALQLRLEQAVKDYSQLGPWGANTALGDVICITALCLCSRLQAIYLRVDGRFNESLTHELLHASLCRTEPILPGISRSLLKTIHFEYDSAAPPPDLTPGLPLESWSFLIRGHQMRKFSGKKLEIVAQRTGISFHNCNHLLPICPSLTQFVVQDSDVDMNGIDILLRACPRLTDFGISWPKHHGQDVATYPVSAKIIGDLLRKHSPLLKRLVLVTKGLPYYPRPSDFPIGSLATFSCLVEVTLTEWAVFGMPSRHPTASFLKDVLPMSIESVHIQEDSMAPMEQSISYMKRSERECEELVAANARPGLRFLNLSRLDRLEIFLLHLSLTREEWREQPRGFCYARVGSLTEDEEEKLAKHQRHQTLSYEELLRWQGELRPPWSDTLAHLQW